MEVREKKTCFTILHDLNFPQKPPGQYKELAGRIFNQLVSIDIDWYIKINTLLILVYSLYLLVTHLFEQSQLISLPEKLSN